ncbi:MAG: DUF3305 domain-containing protein [Burkholderiales bacterium]
MEKVSLPLAVIMERRLTSNRWVPIRWEAIAVLPDSDEPAAGKVVFADSEATHYIYGGFTLGLFRDESENYFLNIGGTDPKVFVMWRLEDDVAKPYEVTLSFGEAARWMDSGENVDGVAMPHDMAVWVSDYVVRHYVPEVKKPKRRDVAK